MEVGEQIASGKRVVRPSDDPQAASRAVGVSQSLATNAQQSDSRVTVRNSLSQEESVLDSVSDALTRAKELMIQAGNGTLSDADRQSQASELRGVYEALLGQANSTDVTPRIGQDKLFWPSNVMYDGRKVWVGEFKFSGRLVGYPIQ